MKNIFLFSYLIALSLSFLSCEKDTSGNIDPNYNAPYLFEVNLSRSILNLDTDTTGSVDSLGNNKYRISVSISGKALRRSSDTPSKNTIRIFKPGNAYPFTVRTISVQGIDTITFSSPITFDIMRSDIGMIRIEASIQTTSGQVSNTQIKTLVITRRNSRPRITHIFMPDSLIIGSMPSPDSSFLVSAAAADSDGLSDIPIWGVQFQSIKPDGTIGNCGSYVPLFDDGSQSPIFSNGSRSGDLVAGDGIFSLKIPLHWRSRNNCPPPDSVDTQRGTYKFIFSAFDNSGAESDTVVYLLKIK